MINLSKVELDSDVFSRDLNSGSASIWQPDSYPITHMSIFRQNSDKYTQKKHLQEERHSKGPVVRLDTWSLHRAMWWTTCSTGRAKLAAFSHFVHIVSDMNPLTLLHSLQAFTRLFGRQHPSASSVQISTLTVFLPIWLLFISSLLNPKVNVKSL